MTPTNYEPMIENPNNAFDELDDMIDQFDSGCDVATAFWQTFANTNDPRHYDAQQALSELARFKNYYKILDLHKVNSSGILGACALLQKSQDQQTGYLFTNLDDPCAVANTIDAMRIEHVLQHIYTITGIDENSAFTPHNTRLMHKAINQLRREQDNQDAK